MKIFLSLLLLLTVPASVIGRFMEAASYEEMFKKANLVVIARPLSTKETKERTTLDKLTLHGLRSLDGPAIPVIGLHTEFETHLVLKGDKNVKKFIVHHYRLESNLLCLLMALPLLLSI